MKSSRRIWRRCPRPWHAYRVYTSDSPASPASSAASAAVVACSLCCARATQPRGGSRASSGTTTCRGSRRPTAVSRRRRQGSSATHVPVVDAANPGVHGRKVARLPGHVYGEAHGGVIRVIHMHDCPPADWADLQPCGGMWADLQPCGGMGLGQRKAEQKEQLWRAGGGRVARGERAVPR